MTRELAAYRTALGEVDANAKAIANKIDEEMKPAPSAEASVQRSQR